MKIVIISDIHDNLVNLKKGLDWCWKNKIKEMICCGDVCNRESLEFLATNFFGEIYLVRGNAEIYLKEDAELYKNIRYFPKFGFLKLGKKQIGFCHQPYFIEDLLKQRKCDIVFYGHTHKPWENTRKNTRLINPGTLGGVFEKSTFAVWDFEKDKIKLIILDAL